MLGPVGRATEISNLSLVLLTRQSLPIFLARRLFVQTRGTYATHPRGALEKVSPSAEVRSDKPSSLRAIHGTQNPGDGQPEPWTLHFPENGK